ncbi:bifunctional adenosylcobinamide kinase/adenosylcobinamide-phosphate guanylyltransferase [Pseudogulbenkiania ferrooxidans]|uniref:Bifunctional adenosylcobalamin biosynthesis protein n=1 Tax=Pseudogulbenkiania ferrooxidans 2002 TaxID=279714 RepID=B9YY25_9NEIS|nr:bifunctional adenosylcobinamide kinase/adenosylcobinamide-phosphate guanylyltransferase [Pseudogulbenkiania ferrooxidans]EEG10030.1 cobalbumin biosynthesis protein [Pseudogulbenkiania ferrooxidans 2002]
MTHLISGGARSGKSRFAEQLALAHPGPVAYVATAAVADADFAARVALHRERRPAHWALCEAERGLAAVLECAAAADTLLLVDCLGMWLMRFCLDDGLDEADFAREKAVLLHALATLPGEIVLVSNEIGWGVVPLGRLSRRFVDELGRLNQDIAALCERVTLVACGLPLVLKAPPEGAASPAFLAAASGCTAPETAAPGGV